MKKTFFLIFTVFAYAGLFAQQPVVAITPFDAISGISATDANMITRVFTIRLGNTQKVAFVDRNIVDRVLQEHRFQTGDWSNAQKTAELGRALNADWIVRGELEKFGSNILVTVQFYNIQTFRFMGGADIRIVNADAAYDNMDPLVNKLIEAIANAQSATVSRTYNIGDRGPAGGFVFYDKGAFSNGWRYLEAAPSETDFMAQWGLMGHEVTGDTTGWVEYGKRNTQLIAEQLQRMRESGRAAQLCLNMNLDGYSDWFLPNIGELELMYKNLEEKGLGNFKIACYWSSDPYDANDNSAWCQRFSDGFQFPESKNEALWVRAIRQF